MKNKITFQQENLWIEDDETGKHYLLIVEIVNGVPKNTIITKIPKAPWQLSRYPYGSN